MDGGGRSLRFGSDWFFQSLWSPSEPVRCSTRVVDTIVVKDGAPVHWLFTSSTTGEVLKKRSMEPGFVREAFLRSATVDRSNVDGVAAVGWTVKGVPKLISTDKFESMMASFESSMKGLSALQCYVHPRDGDGMVYSSEYTLPSASSASASSSTASDGRAATVKTSVVTNVLRPSSSSSSGEQVSAAVDDPVVTAECDAGTRSLVAFLEHSHRMSVTQLTAQFVVDYTGMVRLLRAHNIIGRKISTGASARSMARASIGSANSAIDVDGDDGGGGGGGAFGLSTARSTAGSTSGGGGGGGGSGVLGATTSSIATELAVTTRATIPMAPVGDGWRGSVLIVDNDRAAVRMAVDVLVSAGYRVQCCTSGPKALSATRAKRFDVMLIGRDIPALSGIEVARIIRQREEGMQAANMMGSEAPRLPIIAFTGKTTAEDLREYMEVGMDGCVSKPVDPTALMNTAAAAVPNPPGPPPRVMSPVRDPSAVAARSRKAPTAAWSDSRPRAGTSPDSKSPPRAGTGGPSSTSVGGSRRRKQRPAQLGPMVPSMSSSEVAAAALGIDIGKGAGGQSGSAFENPADGVVGEFTPADGVSLPFVVMGDAKSKAPLFHFVVVNDMFDTLESYQIFFRPIVSKYPGLQVLLFNQPGQANTKWRDGTLLNNEYMAACLRELLKHVGSHGTKQFCPKPSITPFFLMGVGNGANIATCFAMRYSHETPALRSLVLVNGFLHVDTGLAAILHDCVNVFSCSPETRPDLPVYFFSRFLFSPGYLKRVGAPLALNTYTAVDNPITLAGRIALCRGAMAHADLRPAMRALTVPAILVTSTENTLISPDHSGAMVAARGGSTDPEGNELSIRAILASSPARATAIWLQAGHEVMQECRRAVSNLVEQLATGFHDRNDVTFPRVGSASVGIGVGVGEHIAVGGGKGKMEDRYLRNVLKEGGGQAGKPGGKSRGGPRGLGGVSGGLGSGGGGGTNSKGGSSKGSRSMMDESAGDGGTGGTVSSGGGGGLAAAKARADAREYMQWRVRRNRKRLARLQGSVIMVQRAFRAYLARTLASRARNHRHALTVQRWWRGELGRARFRQRQEEDWAARVVQRHWRGYSGRAMIWLMYHEQRAALDIQRVWRGYLGKKWTSLLMEARTQAALKIQTCYRAHRAMLEAFRLRDERNAAVNIQRVYRGRLGRLLAQRERDRFLFSRSQTQGIEFGRQMLTEHRLHGTRLQSEVALLTREKKETEERLEAVLQEIATFEAGVRGLEREMAQLSRAETEAAGLLDESAKVELRENKLRLDREFSTMLVKISDRRETLQALEKQLQQLDRARRKKKEGLRDLERKLVVLLEEQQAELEAIKKRQEKTNTRILSDTVNAVTSDMAGVPSSSSSSSATGGGGGGSAGAPGGAHGGDSAADSNNRARAGESSSGADGGGGGGGGPTPQQRAEANALMANTETMMKFGFMSMSLTYFSSLNMIRAMRKVGTANTLLTNPVLGSVLGTTPSGALSKPQSSGMDFKPSLRAGQFPGQEVTDVSLWTVSDVGEWLESLSLGQYRGAFREASIDGPFLCCLSPEDLRNTLGIEHDLHRKKILLSVQRLLRSQPMAPAGMAAGGGSSDMGAPGMSDFGGGGIGGMGGGGGPGGMGGGGGGGGGMGMGIGSSASSVVSSLDGGASMLMGGGGAGAGTSGSSMISDGSSAMNAPLKLETLMSWVRHNKVRKLANALQSLPDHLFDEADVITPYLDGYGTQYSEALTRLAFHINSADEHGNTLLTVACQNGAQKVASLLIRKGANPSHQNNQGNTALHYAMEYNFYDLGAWMADPACGGARDDVLNRMGLGPYDGLGS